MKTIFYKIECITNLSVGSSDINYNIVDNQVEKDAVNGLPIIHASGIKGALRDAVCAEESVKKSIFGSEGGKSETASGTHKFLDASLITRPMRIYGDNNMASVNVCSVESINSFIKMLNVMGLNKDIKPIGPIDFGGKSFLTNAGNNVLIEGENVGVIPDAALAELKKLSAVIGETIAIAADFGKYDLPVVARNYLVNHISKNLWYEEVVPHGSVFFFAVIVPDDCDEIIDIPPIVQFGGNASIGCGICKVTRLEGVFNE